MNELKVGAMASGWTSVHPLMQQGLQLCGISEDKITQGYGFASASAGFHAPEGRVDNHPFSSCVDLSWSIRSVEMKSRLVNAGFCPFFRDWSGNQHIHCVYVGATDYKSRVTILPGPRTQIIDFTRGLDGLAYHQPNNSIYAPTLDEKEQIKEQYNAWAPHVATKVLSPENNQILCYAFFERGTVRCDLRPFYTYWGVQIKLEDGVLKCYHKDQLLDLSAANLRLEGGQFTRGNVRQLAEAIGLKTDFTWGPNGSYATVKLSY